MLIFEKYSGILNENAVLFKDGFACGIGSSTCGAANGCEFSEREGF